MRCRPHSSRTLAALAIALLLVVSFAGGLHEGLVPHVICPEHGESVELPGHAHVPASFEADSRGEELVERSEGQATSHEHCDVAQLGRTKDLHETRPAPAIRPTSAAPAEVRGPAVRAEPPVPLLSLAPKHSPPSIA